MPKLLPLMIKNFQLQFSNPIQTLFELVMPVLALVYIIMMQNRYSSSVIVASLFDEKNVAVDALRYMKEFDTILYAPTHRDTARIMYEAKMNYFPTITNMYDFYNEREMIEYAQADGVMDRVICCVSFVRNSIKDEPMGNTIHYKIMFPWYLRSGTLANETRYNTNWGTNTPIGMVPDLKMDPFQKVSKITFASSPDYYNEGFLAIMSAVSESIINHFHRKVGNLRHFRRDNVIVENFPIKEHHDKAYLGYFGRSLGLLVALGYVVTVMCLIWIINWEKQTGIKRHLRSMGVSNMCHWLAWSLKTQLFWLIIILIYCISFKLIPNFFSYTNWFCLFIFMLFYSLACMTFCFMISAIFVRADIAACVGGICFMLSFMPFFMMKVGYYDAHYSVKILCSIFINTALSLGMELFTLWELQETGAKLFTSPSAQYKLTIGWVMFMLFIDFVVFLLLAMLIEFCHQDRAFLPLKSKERKKLDDSKVTNEKSTRFEENHTQGLINLSNVRKQYHSNVALDISSLSAQENQVTVVLGAAASGKTTLYRVITGTTARDSGKVLVNKTDFGLCPQQNLLYPTLTTSQNIHFYARIKGANKNQFRRNVDFWKLNEYELRRVKKIPDGIKRRICLAIAFFGESRTIILDEPTVGVNAVDKEEIWKIITVLKKSRTVLLLTQSVVEAEKVGDRIGIISDGRLLCCGSIYFLKNAFEMNALLVFNVLPDCKEQVVTAFMQQYFNEIKPEYNSGLQLSYILPKISCGLPKFFQLLIENKKNLRFVQFTIILTSLQHVYDRVSYEVLEKEEKIFVELNLHEFKREHSCMHTYGQYTTQHFKHYWDALHGKKLFLLKIILPALIMLLFWGYTQSDPNLPPMKMTYNERNLSFTTDSAWNLKAATAYCNKNNIECYYNEKTNESEEIRIGLLDSKPYILYDTTHNYHSAAIGMAAYYDALTIKYFGPDKFQIITSNQPLPFTRQVNLSFTTGTIFFITLGIGTGLLLLCVMISWFYIREHESNFDHIQYMHGGNMIIIWLSALLWDLMTLAIAIIFFIFGIFLMNENDGFRNELVAISAFILLFGLATFPMIYVFRLIRFAMLAILAYLFITGILAFIMLAQPLDWGDGMDKLFGILSPLYCLMQCIFRSAVPRKKKDMCLRFINLCVDMKKLESTCKKESCLSSKFCCENYVHPNSEIVFYIFMMILHFLVFSAILLILEYKLLGNLRKARKQHEEAPQNEEITLEKERVEALGAHDPDSGVVINNLNNMMSFAVRYHECFVIYGGSETGKTRFMLIMSRQDLVSAGDAYVEQTSIRTHFNAARCLMGYCPERPYLIANMSPREHLLILISIRGYRGRHVRLAVHLANYFRISRDLDKPVEYIGTENRRILHFAMCLIGDSSVLLLDVPTRGLRPSEKQHIWRTLNSMIVQGKSIVLTTDEIVECEVNAIRMGILTDSHFLCLGSPIYLRTKYANYYNLNICVQQQEFACDTHNVYVMIENYVNEHFSNVILREHKDGWIYYFLIIDGLPNWVQMFSTMDDAQRIYPIIEYNIGQASLESVVSYMTSSSTASSTSLLTQNLISSECDYQCPPSEGQIPGVKTDNLNV